MIPGFIRFADLVRAKLKATLVTRRLGSVDSQRIETELEGYLDREEHADAKAFHRSTLKKVGNRIREHRSQVTLGLVLISIATVTTILEPWVFGQAIDRAIVTGKKEQIPFWAGLYFSVVVFRVVSVVLQARIFEQVGQKVIRKVRLQLYQRLQSLPMEVYDRNPTGRLVTRVTNDVQTLGDMFSAGFVSMALNLLTITGILVWMVIVQWKLALWVLLVMPFLFYAVGLYSAKLRIAYRNARSRLSALNAFLAENILGMRVVQLFGRESLHLERFDRLNAWYMQAQKGTVLLFAFFQPTITLAQGIAMTLLLYFGAESAIRGEVQPGMLVAFFAYVSTLFQPMRELADKWNIFLSGMASAERIFGLLEWRPEVGSVDSFEEPTSVKTYIDIQGRIEFQNVWFAYDGREQWALKDLNLVIEPGQSLGIVGHTGAGKSTLISLLLRFREPQKGRILLDGKDLREYDRRRLRASVGLVQQDVFLFSGSIEENIHLWREPDRVSAQMDSHFRTRENLERLGLQLSDADFAKELDERGGNLSAGERQILAFERARYSDPRIWILDEATSNIDSETELKLSQEFEAAAQGKTKVLIAHRLATVRDCDRILVLHRGEKVEWGTHAELIAQDGLYARLYRYQTSTEELQATLAQGAVPHLTPAT